MDLGRRKYLIYVEVETATDNGDGTFTSTVTESLSPIFASKRPASERRLLENGTVGLEGMVTFNILKNDYPNLSKINRIRDGADTYTIHSVIELTNQKELEIIGIIKR